MIQHEFPSGGLNETQMIDHIKFIAKSLLTQSKRTISPQTHPYKHNRNSSPSERRNPEDDYNNSECVERQYNRIKSRGTETQQKKKKIPIFQDIAHLLQTNNKNKQKQFVPISEQINKQVYGKFKQQNVQNQDYIHQNRNKIDKQQKNQELWNDFLNRQSKWLSHKKTMLQQLKLAEIAHRNNLSNSRKSHRTKTAWDQSPKRVQSKYFNEMDMTIKKLRDDTQRLRTKVLQIASRNSSKSSREKSREGKSFVKTFQYQRK